MTERASESAWTTFLVGYYLQQERIKLWTDIEGEELFAFFYKQFRVKDVSNKGFQHNDMRNQQISGPDVGDKR